MQNEELTTLGLIDRNMIAVLRTSLGYFSTLPEAEEMISVFQVQPGRLSKLFVNLAVHDDLVIDPIAFQFMFHAIFPRYAHDRHAAFHKSMAASHCPRCFKQKKSYSFLTPSGCAANHCL